MPSSQVAAQALSAAGRCLRGWVALGSMPLVMLVCSCDESLPTRIVPQNNLAITDVLISQQTGAAGIEVLTAFFVKNTYEETFSGTVEVTGSIHIWWKERPHIEVNLPIRQHLYLRLDPGERHQIEKRWHLQTDDDRYVLDLLDFSGNDVRHGVRYARPADFLLEIRLTVFEETGLLTSGPHEFVLQGWKLVPPLIGP